jgi:c-di-AMP phosphodiesterase-like protein
MRALLRSCARTLALTLILGSLFTLTARAQSRVNDRDVERLMSNLREDVSQFRGPYEAALKKSSFRKTSKEKDAKDLGKRLEDESKNMLKTFQKKRKADQSFNSVDIVAQQIDPIVHQLDPQSSAIPAWGRVQSDLKAIGSAVGLPLTAVSVRRQAEQASFQ